MKTLDIKQDELKKNYSYYEFFVTNDPFSQYPQIYHLKSLHKKLARKTSEFENKKSYVEDGTFIYGIEYLPVL